MEYAKKYKNACIQEISFANLPHIHRPTFVFMPTGFSSFWMFCMMPLCTFALIQICNKCEKRESYHHQCPLKMCMFRMWSFSDCYVAYQGKMVMVWCIQQKAAKMKPYVIRHPVQQHHKMMLLLFDGVMVVDNANTSCVS